MAKEDRTTTYAENFSFLGAKVIGETVAGLIYRKKLTHYHPHATIPVIHDRVLQLIGHNIPGSERYRRGMASKLKENSPNPMPVIGKPSSAFIFVDRSNSIFMDYLVESATFVRSETVHHSFMTQFDEESGNNNYHPFFLYTRDSMWSGHVALLTREYRSLDYGQVMLLDKFSNLSNLSPLDRSLVNMLHENKIIPLTARGQIIPL